MSPRLPCARAIFTRAGKHADGADPQPSRPDLELVLVGGRSNPLSVVEQITYLLFIKRLDELHTLEESKAATLGVPMTRPVFPQGVDGKGRGYDDLRWSRFKNFEPREMYVVVDEHVFPFLRSLGETGSAFGTHVRDARFGIPTPNLFAKVVQNARRDPDAGPGHQG